MLLIYLFPVFICSQAPRIWPDVVCWPAIISIALNNLLWISNLFTYLFTFSWADYSLIQDCDWWIPLAKLMHICMVWTSHDKTLRFYWFLKFGQLPTHPSVFSPRKSRHAPKFTHPSPGTNVNVTRGNFKLWLCAGSDVVGSLLILSIFYSRQLCYMTSLSGSITFLVHILLRMRGMRYWGCHRYLPHGWQFVM